MNEIIDKLKSFRIVPIITLEDPGDIVPLGEALISGGLPIAEITFRTGAAVDALKLASRKFPDFFLGAGTILSAEQVDIAFSSGARFMVTPGFNPRVVDHCIKKKITIIPGLNTPTQIEQALERGIEYVKFFPAEASGGIPFINAVAAPYGRVRFMATGGINAGNLKNYLSNKYIFACGGSWMVRKELIESGNFAKITRLVKESLEIIRMI
ncbi:MAG: bifunctional 4-hydroxy-2-oxoglutarate aldolase/2-dehydro-3-deoxy-phosphogluconate aldolase [Bacteroidales bacterium]|nr:MAG: bifunctional 4-hydroxy-2-oxoglutarate aldolase/2-dehydro-3-deoxy-phosphogluconate aldolase [Bacteroidales bacterium]